MENTITILGDRVLIQLDLMEDHTITPSGVVVPLYQNIESDGGRPDIKESNLRYLSKGTVVSISDSVKEKVPLSAGDRVFVAPSCVSPTYQFYSRRTGLVENFEGLISIPPAFIEAKIN